MCLGGTGRKDIEETYMAPQKKHTYKGNCYFLSWGGGGAGKISVVPGSYKKIKTVTIQLTADMPYGQ